MDDKWLAEQLLKFGDYSDEEIKFALEKEEGTDAELLSEAAMAIEEIITGDEPIVKLNRGATIAFVKKIRDYAYDESDSLDDATFAKLLQYAMKHLEVAKNNELERNKIFAMATGQLPTGEVGQEVMQRPVMGQPVAGQQNEPAIIGANR